MCALETPVKIIISVLPLTKNTCCKQVFFVLEYFNMYIRHGHAARQQIRAHILNHFGTAAYKIVFARNSTRQVRRDTAFTAFPHRRRLGQRDLKSKITKLFFKFLTTLCPKNIFFTTDTK